MTTRSRHTHRRRPGRITIHAAVVVMLVAGLLAASRTTTTSGAVSLSTFPSLTFSSATRVDMRAAAAYVRPGSSLLTRESSAVSDATPDVLVVRGTAAIAPTSSFSSSVAAVSAASGEVGAGIKPLADILDPTVPFVLYEVQPGDSPSSIAAKYNISVSTLYENNPTAVGTTLHPGGQLIVPRRDGVLYKVGFGETVASIVEKYLNVTVGMVVDYRPNAISDPNNLRAGEYILLPNAVLKPPPPPPPPPPSRGPGPITGGGDAPAPGGQGIFSYPLARWFRISDPFGTPRGSTYHTGIDFDLWGMSRSNIFAACDGVVTRTEYWTYSYGYHVVVDCGGGFSTLYAHLDSIAVAPGQHVNAGTIIGVSGLTGYTTGEHLHFEIRYNGVPVDPAAYLPV